MRSLSSAQRRTLRGVLCLVLVLSSVACNNAYCQSGPKHGTQCYSQSELEAEKRQRGDDPQRER